jgi:class 3 adenylate cyclase
MSILFSDIRSFTTLSESMMPDENFAFINAYLERMGPVIRDHNGFIDKYIGDAIMALFKNADDALRAGLAMLDTLDQFNAGRRAAGQQPIAIGIGINTGSLMLGTIGERHRMDGTVISDAVNLAARVESLTKDYKGAAADLGVHLAATGRSQHLRHPVDRCGGGEGQDAAGHYFRGLSARFAD